MTVKNSVPSLHSTLVDGVEIAWAEWGDKNDPVLLLVHATGFHGRCWDQIASKMGGVRVIAMDLRGHGQSASNFPVSWEHFGRDVINFIVQLDLRSILAAGHSFGGHCVIQAAAQLPGRFAQLFLIDPVVFAPSIYAQKRFGPNPAEAISRRRNVWESPQQMFEEFRDREPFSSWRDDVLQDYCEFGLVRASNSDHYELACAPSFEAAIYGGAIDADIHDCLSKVSTPVTVVRAKSSGIEVARQSFMASPTWPELASAFERGQDIYLPEYSHFIPMEDPNRVASIIRDLSL
jgi:pimeloyl-ACP methyl ester carboxylesterase